MNYIYDILANFNKNNIDFFEWNKNDDIIRIKKIPVIRINTKDFKKIITNRIIINNSLISRIKYKTELLNNNKNKFSFLLMSDGNNTIILKFDNSGNELERSYLYIDEELEILETIQKLDISKIEYTVLEKIKNNLKTRYETTKRDFLINEIKKLEKNNDTNKIKYIYYECYNIKENNTSIIISKLKKIINTDYTKEYSKLYNFFKLTSIKIK